MLDNFLHTPNEIKEIVLSDLIYLIKLLVIANQYNLILISQYDLNPIRKLVRNV
jgi:hypothetical protein